MSKYAISSFNLAVLLVSVVGCSKPSGMDSQQIEAYRTSFTLSDEPDSIQTVADVRAALVGNFADHDSNDHDGDGEPDHTAEDHAAEDHADDAHADADHDHEHHGDDHHSHEHGHDHAHEAMPQTVAMVGHIGGLANPWSGVHPDYPFAKSEALFFLADPQAVIENEEAGHKHAPGEECAFCAAHAADKADMIAIVQFVDAQGKVIKSDIRDLFDVKEHDTVVVEGEARIAGEGILVVNARGLYIRE